MNLLISYSWGSFHKARNEALRILRQLGDGQPEVERSHVEGIALVHTCLDSRDVIHKCRQLLQSGEEYFDFALKWVPVDYWCVTDLEAMKQVIEKKVIPRIQPDETWGMMVYKRRWEAYHRADIVAHLAPCIDRKVDLEHPDRIVWVDVVGRKTAISVLKPEEIFSVVLEG
jgi:tRNA(Ser,Leu) C12 N-acetylase TAN1